METSNTEPTPGMEAPNGSSSTGPRGAKPNSRWWYWIAAVPLLQVIFFFVVPFFFFFMVAGLDLTGGIAHFVPFSMPLFLLLIVAIAVPSFIVTLMLPIALYFDSEAVNEVDTDWNPDSTLYALLGVVAIFVGAVGLPLSVYYLYQRHKHVGTP